MHRFAGIGDARHLTHRMEREAVDAAEHILQRSTGGRLAVMHAMRQWREPLCFSHAAFGHFEKDEPPPLFRGA